MKSPPVKTGGYDDTAIWLRCLKSRLGYTFANFGKGVRNKQ